MTKHEAAKKAHQQFELELDFAHDTLCKDHKIALRKLLESEGLTMGFVRLCIAMSFAEYSAKNPDAILLKEFLHIGFRVLYQYYLAQPQPEKQNERKQ